MAGGQLEGEQAAAFLIPKHTNSLRPRDIFIVIILSFSESQGLVLFSLFLLTKSLCEKSPVLFKNCMKNKSVPWRLAANDP